MVTLLRVRARTIQDLEPMHIHTHTKQRRRLGSEEQVSRYRSTGPFCMAQLSPAKEHRHDREREKGTKGGGPRRGGKRICRGSWLTVHWLWICLFHNK